MGQPNYPQYPPQGYAPQQQYPQQQPQPDPWAQQAMSGHIVAQQAPPAQPAPPQYANQGQQMAQANPLADPFANAGVGERIGGFKTGPNGHPVVNAALRNLGSGRIVILVPKQLKRGVANPFPESAEKKPFRDELTADVIVCTGDPFKFGGNNKDIPDTLGPVSVPCVIPDAFITNDGVIEKVPEARVGKGIVVAHLVLVKTAKGNYAWNANEVPTSEYDKYGCRQAYQAYVAEQLPKAEGEQPLKVVANAAPAPLPPAPMQPQYAQPAMIATPAGPVQQPVPQWPPMQPGQNMAPMQQQYPPQPVSAPVALAPDWTLGVAPPAGYEAVWPTWSPAQREQVWRQMNPGQTPGFQQGPGY